MLGLAAVFLLPPAARGAPLTYARYLKMDKAAKDRLIRKYVRRDSKNYWLVSVSKYEVHTKISAEFALRMAVLMDNFYVKFTKIFKKPFLVRTQPKLYVFPDMKTYNAFLRTQRARAGFSVGMYLPGAQLLVAQRGQGDKALKDILFHEGTHQLLHAFTGRKEIPPWFNEGMAANFETWSLERSPAENIKLNVLDNDYRDTAMLAVAKGKVYRLVDLFRLSDRAWSEAKDPSMNYAMSWALVNYLLHSRRNVALLDRMIGAVRTGRGLNEVITPRVKLELQLGWHQDIKTRMVLYQRYIIPALALERAEKGRIGLALLKKAPKKLAALPAARFYRGRILCNLGRHAEAIGELRAAEKADNNFPDLYALLARAYAGKGNKAKARYYRRKATARSSR